MANQKGDHESVAANITGPLFFPGMRCYCGPLSSPVATLSPQRKTNLTLRQATVQGSHIQDPGRTVAIDQIHRFLSFIKTHGTRSHCIGMWSGFIHLMRFAGTLQCTRTCLFSLFGRIFHLQKPWNCSSSYIYVNQIKKAILSYVKYIRQSI